jgi:intracellular sulfur oxidation DsrE/DsrF family protein
MSSNVTDLDLNAYIDGELSHDQETEILEAMRENPELAKEICQLGQHKAQLRIAYANPPRPQRQVMRQMQRSWRAIAAGISLLAMGLVGGLLLSDISRKPVVDNARFVVLDADGRGQAPAVAESEETRIVFHLTNSDPMVAGELLDEVESMLQAYAADGRPLRVEVVSHSDGLDMLRQSLTAHADRIHGLAGAYGNLTFVACKNTIDRLRVDHGIEVKLLPDAEVTESGVSHVVRRQKQGWSYIRV